MSAGTAEAVWAMASCMSASSGVGSAPTTAAMRTMPSYSSSSPDGSTQTTFSPSASIFSMASC